MAVAILSFTPLSWIKARIAFLGSFASIDETAVWRADPIWSSVLQEIGFRTHSAKVDVSELIPHFQGMMTSKLRRLKSPPSILLPTSSNRSSLSENRFRYLRALFEISAGMILSEVQSCEGSRARRGWARGSKPQ